jgi:hypothetical protein
MEGNDTQRLTKQEWAVRAPIKAYVLYENEVGGPFRP